MLDDQYTDYDNKNNKYSYHYLEISKDVCLYRACIHVFGLLANWPTNELHLTCDLTTSNAKYVELAGVRCEQSNDGDISS